MEKGAEISECSKYRYSLWRIWDKSKPMVMFLMLNPSTADATEDDNTITRCINYAKSWGYGSLYVCNVFAYRSTHPLELLKQTDPFGPENYKYIDETATKADKIICAWGNKPVIQKFMPYDVVHLRYEEFLPKMYYLALSKHYVPIHPLYLKADLVPKKL